MEGIQGRIRRDERRIMDRSARWFFAKRLKTFTFSFLRATAECSRVLAMVWASVWLSFYLAVTLLICIKTVQAKITNSLLLAATRILVFRDKILCLWVRRFASNKGVKEGYP